MELGGYPGHGVQDPVADLDRDAGGGPTAVADRPGSLGQVGLGPDPVRGSPATIGVPGRDPCLEVRFHLGRDAFAKGPDGVRGHGLVSAERNRERGLIDALGAAF